MWFVVNLFSWYKYAEVPGSGGLSRHWLSKHTANTRQRQYPAGIKNPHVLLAYVRSDLTQGHWVYVSDGAAKCLYVPTRKSLRTTKSTIMGYFSTTQKPGVISAPRYFCNPLLIMRHLTCISHFVRCYRKTNNLRLPFLWSVSFCSWLYAYLPHAVRNCIRVLK